MTDLKIGSEIPYRLKKASRFYGPKEMMEEGGPKFHLHLTDINTQAREGLVLEGSFTKSVDDYNYYQWSRSLIGLIGEGEGRDYLEGQIKDYVENSPIWKGRTDNLGLEEALRLSYEVVCQGTGNHDGEIDSIKLRVQDALDIHNPQATKCTLFNELFVGSYEIISKLYNPELIKKHRLIQHPSTSASDLPRKKEELLTSAKKKLVVHSFLTLVSGAENGIMYTSVDPYHVRRGDDFASGVDFSEKRKGDSLIAILAVAFANSGKDHGVISGSKSDENTIALGILEAMRSDLSINDKAVLGSMISGIYWPAVWANRISSAKEFDDKKKELTNKIHDNLASRDGLNSQNAKAWALDPSRYSYNDLNRISYIGSRFRNEAEEEMEGMMESTMGGIVGDLMKQIGTKGPEELDPNLLTYFFDIMDSVGYFNLPIGLEVWDKVIEFLDTDLKISSAKWREYEEKRGEGYDDLFMPINKRSNYNDFRIQFVNKWDFPPTQTYATEDDLKIIEDEKDEVRLKYTIFKAKVLSRIRDFGIRGWEKYLPTNAPEGSYADLLVKMINEEELIPAE